MVDWGGTLPLRTPPIETDVFYLLQFLWTIYQKIDEIGVHHLGNPVSDTMKWTVNQCIS